MPLEATIAIWVVTWAAIAFGFGLDIMNARALGEMRFQFQTLVNLLGERFAKILHSPHTPELDSYLEKLMRKEPLNEVDRKNLSRILNDIENNVGGERPKEERLIASLIKVIIEMKSPNLLDDSPRMR